MIFVNNFDSEIYLKQFQKNTEKVKLSLTSKKHFDTISDSIITHYHNYIEKRLSTIPNIVHFIFGLEKQVSPFPYVFFIAIYSCYKVNKPDKIYFHYHYEPYGEYWEKTKEFIILNYVPDLSMKWGEKKIIKTAHKADKVRLEMLFKYGGVYMDIDTISYRPFKEYLENDFCIGIQEKNFGPTKKTLFGNAILLSKPYNPIIKKWIESYESKFEPDGWCEASIHYTTELIEEFSPKKNNQKIFIFEEESFYKPDYYQVKEIFENFDIKNFDIKNLITLHYWNSFSKDYINSINSYEDCKKKYPNSLYFYLLSNIVNYS